MALRFESCASQTPSCTTLCCHLTHIPHFQFGFPLPTHFVSLHEDDLASHVCLCEPCLLITQPQFYIFQEASIDSPTTCISIHQGYCFGDRFWGLGDALSLSLVFFVFTLTLGVGGNQVNAVISSTISTIYFSLSKRHLNNQT